MSRFNDNQDGTITDIETSLTWQKKDSRQLTGRWMHLEKSQKLAMFPPALQPKGGTTIHTTIPIDRQTGLKLYQEAEYPRAARLRTTTNSKDQ